MKTALIDAPIDPPHALTSPAPETLRMPSSRAQQLIWDRARQKPNPAAWNIAVRFTLHGELRTAAFKTAVGRVVAANEILRTSLISHMGELSQLIHSAVKTPVSVIDLSLLPAAEQQKTLDERSLAEARRPFNLAVAPLLRVTLLRLSPCEHVLLLTVHHAICDGWSIGLLSNALISAYEEQLHGLPASENANIQYADYTVWQNQRRETPEYQQHAAYWTEYLSAERDKAGNRASATISCDPTADASDLNGAITSFVLPVPLTDRLSALARQHGATFFQVVASAFALLMTAETNQQRVVFGSPVPGRDSTELESIIGPFVNYLPVSITCAPEVSFSELLCSTSTMFLDWVAHSEYRRADILDALNQSADPFEALFICQRDFVRTVERGGLRLAALPSVSPGALYGLTFFMVERADGWRLSCEIDGARYSFEKAQALLRTYQQILESIADNPEQRLAQIAAQVQNIKSKPLARLASATATSATSVHAPPVNSFFDFPASETQKRYYLLDCAEPGQSTFHLCIRIQVDGELKAVLVAEAIDVLVRRHEILRTTFVMVGEQLRQRVHEPALPPSFEYRDFSSLPTGERDQALRSALLRDDHWQFDLATGPLFRAFVADLGESGGQRRWIASFTLAHLLADGWSGGILQKEFQEIYTALLAGAAHHLADSPLQYGDCSVAEEQWLQSPAVEPRVAFWRDRLSGKMAALDLPVDSGAAQSAKTNGSIAISTMDASLTASVRLLARDLETTPFVIYGAVFQALLFRYSGETDITFSTPLANRTAETETVVGPFSIPLLLRTMLQPNWSLRQYIHALHHVAMDSFDNPLPFEKYADSVALSTVRGRHALNQMCFFYQKAFVQSAELNGLRFTPLPTSVAGAPFEWQLAIIERLADSVTAELQYDADLYSACSIDTALRHYERLLSESIFHLDTPIASIPFATSEELVQAAGLPENLAPISKRALGIEMPPATQQPAGAGSASPVFPRSTEEIAMTSLWQRAFRRRESISIHDNFFDLGGHSLTLARLQALCQRELGRRIHAADMFAAPTIASLTLRLKGADTAEALNPRLIPLQASGTQPPLFLISQSMVFRQVAERLGPEQPVYTVRIEDADLRGSESFEEFARFYVNVIRQFRPHGPYRIGGWCAAGWIAYEIAQQLRALGETVEMLLIVDAWAPGYWRDLPTGRRLAAKMNFYWARLNLHRRTLQALPFDQQTAFLKERFRLWRAAITRQLGSISFLRGLPKQIDADTEITFVDQVQYAASLAYHAQPWPGTTLLFSSSEQPVGKFLARDMGWSSLLEEQAGVTVLPGDHRKIFDAPGAQIIADAVKNFLTKTPTDSPSPRAACPAPRPTPSNAASELRICELVTASGAACAIFRNSTT